MRRINAIIGVLSVVWGVLFFLFLKFFPQSAYDLLGASAFQYSAEEIALYADNLRATIVIIRVIVVVLLMVLCIASVINCKKSGRKILENNLLSNSVKLLIAGTVIQIIGAVGVAWIFVVVSGILAIIYNPGI